MKILSTSLTLLLLAACAVGPDYEKPEINTPDAYRFSDEEASDVVNTEWWTQFDDPVLNELIDEALRSNLDVRTAAARHSIGTGIIGGMIGATTLALFFVPLFYYLIMTAKEKMAGKQAVEETAATDGEA